MPHKYKAVLFDMDGTLLDTLGDLQEIVNHIMEKYGFPTHTKDEVKQYVGNGVVKLIENALPDGSNTPGFDEIISYTRSYYDVHPGNNTIPYPGINDVIHRFSEEGIKMAVVTNKIQSAAVALRDKYFPEIDVVSGERESEGLKRKPAPDTVLWAAEKLGATVEECIYVGDSEVDIQTARNSGMKCISVLWGFREKSFLEKFKPDYFADDVDELYRIVNK